MDNMNKEKLRLHILTVIKYKRNNIAKRELLEYMNSQGFTLDEFVYILDTATKIVENTI